jgi:putative nucleotidyltransferase with HDIG domain
MQVPIVHPGVTAALARISDALERLGHETSPTALLRAMARELHTVLGATACVISRCEGDGERLREVAASWADRKETRSSFADYVYLLDDYPLTRVVLESGEPRALSLGDAGVEPTEAFVLRELGMDSVVMLPLPHEGAAWGLVEVYDVGARRFTPADITVADFVVRQAAGVLAQLENTESVQRLYRETLASLANALEEKDAYTHDHTQEVVGLALDVAASLGLDAEEQDLVELGALLHDIGKIRVPESILNKPGPLDDEEWGIMRSHTVAGEAILAPITSLGDVLPIVRSSHERWDGVGYPDGLAGDDIPVGARIVAVCDAYRAMTERRPYRDPMTESDALAELRRNAGTQFDPACVRALIAVLGARRRTEPLRLHRPAHAA